MLFQLIVLLVIVLLTAYLATQGWLSATLVFVSATFASILAGALYEPFSGILSGWRPDFANGVIFLLVFFLAFSALRITADKIVVGNVKLDVWVDRAGGGVVGLLAALVVTGTTVIGIEMMPLPEAIMGGVESSLAWNPYPAGPRTKRDNLWLNPDGFVAWIYEMSLGRSMGGAYGESYTFAQVHPDLRQELWGYRHRTQLQSNFSMLPEVMETPEAWRLPQQQTEAVRQANSSFSEDSGWLVRLNVQKGSGSVSISADPEDGHFRATPTQVRLVAMDRDGQPVQLYPVGYFARGKEFVKFDQTQKTPPQREYLVADYVPAGEKKEGPERAIVDFVFEIPSRYTPKFLEVKSLARKRVEIVEAPKVLQASAYPPESWRANQFKARIVMLDGTTKIPSHLVYVLKDGAPKKVFATLFREGTQTLEANAGLPGPYQARIQTANSRMRDVYLGKDEQYSWSGQVIPTAVWVPVRSTGASVSDVVKHITANIAPLTRDPQVTCYPFTTNKEGATEEAAFMQDQHCIFTWYENAGTVYVWAVAFKPEEKKSTTFRLLTKKAPDTPKGTKDCLPEFIFPSP